MREPVNIHPSSAETAMVFKDGNSAEAVIRDFPSVIQLPAVLELPHHAATVIQGLFYIEEFARQKRFFRRVRVPPIPHVYGDSIFINHGVRKVIRHFVADSERALRSGEAAAELLPRMIDLAGEAGLPMDDIEHMRDAFSIILLDGRYYFLPFDAGMAEKSGSPNAAINNAGPRNLAHATG
jgi:hypothetical protein